MNAEGRNSTGGGGGSFSTSSPSVAKQALDDAQKSERAVELIFEELMVLLS